MFDRLSERFDDIFRSLRGQGRITERNIDETLREVRRSLLEADVNFKVAKGFIQRVKDQALGQDVLKSLTPGQQLVKIVHDELIGLLGGHGEVDDDLEQGGHDDDKVEAVRKTEPREGVRIRINIRIRIRSV